MNLKYCEVIVLLDIVWYIGKGVFMIDNKLKYVYFGKLIEIVEDDVFNFDSLLELVVFLEGIKSIGILVFWGILLIKFIIILVSVIEIIEYFYFVDNCNLDVEIYIFKGLKVEEVVKVM